MMRTVGKIRLLLTTVILLVLSLPASNVLAQGTTVEVNNGNTIILNVGATRTASGSSGIPITVKNLPALGAPANGLAAFTFDFSWNPAVIRVDSAVTATAAGWTAILAGEIDIANGRVRAAGITMAPYSTADVTLLYLGITAVGRAGDSTSISVTITALGDKDGNRIAATPVNAPVTISAPTVTGGGGGGGGAAAATLVSLAVTPTEPSISQGATQQFMAVGTYTNNTVVNITDTASWSSSDEAIATVQSSGAANPGLANGLAPGTTTITATMGVKSATARLIVTKVEGETAAPPPPGEKKVTPPAPSGAEKTVTTVPSTKESAVTAPTAAPAAPPGPPLPAQTGTGNNWWLIGGITAGVVILGLVLYLLLGRRAGF